MLTSEIRRMLLVRSLLAEPGAPRLDSSFDRYKDRVAPYLDEPLPPFGSPFGGKADGYALFKAAERSSRFTVPELAKALARAADVDVKLKSSAPVLETLTAYVGGVIAGTFPAARAEAVAALRLVLETRRVRARRPGSPGRDRCGLEPREATAAAAALL